ncbi:MAG: hypothetical protein ACREX8_21330 [Gammaproteobacteria bacterium]
MKKEKLQMMKLRAVVLAGALGLATVILPATTAQAATMHGCAWPYVCLYDGSYQTGSIFWRAQQTVSQTTPTNRADAVVNSRNDDSVWLIDRTPSPDHYICIPANTAVNLGSFDHPGYGTWANDIDAMKIWSDDGKCNGGYAVSFGTTPDRSY